jgi:hypothetical protein
MLKYAEFVVNIYLFFITTIIIIILTSIRVRIFVFTFIFRIFYLFTETERKYEKRGLHALIGYCTQLQRLINPVFANKTDYFSRVFKNNLLT